MYVGRTSDVENRLKEHNAGESIHTNKYIPWKLATYLAFDSKEKALFKIRFRTIIFQATSIKKVKKYEYTAYCSHYTVKRT